MGSKETGMGRQSSGDRQVERAAWTGGARAWQTVSAPCAKMPHMTVYCGYPYVMQAMAAFERIAGEQ